MYKLTSSQSIPHFRPNGKKLYFKRSELNDWLLRNRVDTTAEVEQQAADYSVCSQIKMNFFAQNLREVSANLVKNFDTVFF